MQLSLVPLLAFGVTFQSYLRKSLPDRQARPCLTYDPQMLRPIRIAASACFHRWEHAQGIPRAALLERLMTMKLIFVFVFLQLLGATAVSSKAKSRPAPYQQHPTSNPTNDSAVLFVFPNGSARTEKAGVFQQGPHTVPCPVCGSTGILKSLQTF